MLIVSLKHFEDKVKAVEPKSSFFGKGGDPRPADMEQLVQLARRCRDGTTDVWKVSLDQLKAFQELIWQVGTKDSPWQLAKQRYADALRYLVQKLFLTGPVAEGAISPDDALLLGEYKKNWMEMMLVGETCFWHRSSVRLEDLIGSKGISTRYATEVCMPDGGLLGDWRYGSKFVFTVKAGLDDEGQPVIDKGGKLKSFGFGDHALLIRQAAGTRYMSDYPVSTTREASSRQVAFPDDIPLERITVYKGGKRLDPHPWKVLP